MNGSKRADDADHFYPNTEELAAGALALATDFMVVNVTKEEAIHRMAVVSHHVWPNKARHAGFAEAGD